jgi:hypothetical protein
VNFDALYRALYTRREEYRSAAPSSLKMVCDVLAVLESCADIGVVRFM